ncbi:MAG: helix-turn-helix transcriptional regulator [Acutalibacteraceae bacterium]
MPKSSNQKLKLLYLMKILQQHTDEEHAITLARITEMLYSYGITAERKSLYDDLEALRTFGIDVVKRKGKTYEYYIANRDFQLPELKLLVDAVQSSKFLTVKKSNELIKKLESLASTHEAQLLQRQVVVANRIKNMNECIYYNVDTIHLAISLNKQISFTYFEWAVSFDTKEKIKKRPRKGGAAYVVSPWCLTWDNENYYLIAYDSLADKLKHYRVDKMQSINILDFERDGEDTYGGFNSAEYAKKTFGMYGGEEQSVKLKFKNELIGVVVDRFGKDIFITKDGDDSFTVNVSVMVSGQFFAWLFGLADGVTILSPESVIKQYKKHGKKALKKYK